MSTLDITQTTWNALWLFALPALACWGLGAWLSFRQRSRTAVSVPTMLGLLVFGGYIMLMWFTLQRPPLRTMGETRLWYSFFLPLVGFVTYLRWGYRWVLSFSTLLSAVFISINLLRPEIHSKALMPALQSPWFVPHVIIYMFAYATMGAATLMAIWQLWRRQDKLAAIDELVRVGFAFITIGMLFGALWAKEAWGTYWTWDPKETWAAATWLCYLAYMHLRLYRPTEVRWALCCLIFSFACLQMCWWGINYLPSAQGMSFHTYTD